MIYNAHVMALLQDLGKCRASSGTSYAIHCLEYYLKVLKYSSKELEMMRSDKPGSNNTPTILIDN